jgi:Family of unknown function (DUF6011)
VHYLREAAAKAAARSANREAVEFFAAALDHAPAQRKPRKLKVFWICSPRARSGLHVSHRGLVTDSSDEHGHTCWSGHQLTQEFQPLRRHAVLVADARRHERRIAAAKLAAETRGRRRKRKVYAAAKKLTFQGDKIGPRNNCVICGRGLDDPQSIARGVGSECWQDVLTAISQQTSPDA